MTVQERLKAVREAHKNTQKEIAVLLGISPRTWQDYEGGINVPGWKVLEGLAKLGFNANWILTGEGSMSKSGGREILSTQVNLNEISSKIRKIRGDISIKEFADSLCITENELKKLENGEIEPGYGLLNRLCFEYDVSTLWLIEDIGDMKLVNEVDVDLLEFASVLVCALDESISNDDELLTEQKKLFIAVKLYEHLKKIITDKENSPSLLLAAKMLLHAKTKK